MLTLSNLLIGYGSSTLAPPLSASLETGSLAVLVGRNGSGKSTLLRTLCGLRKPLGGDVRWNGKSLSQMGHRELARRVSVVLTASPNTGMMTVYETVALGRMPHTPLTGRLSERDKKAIGRAVALCSLENLRERAVASLSDGERQRTMIAKALAQETPAVILDEPTAYLDYAAKEEVLRLLHRFVREEGKLILLATHDLASARRYADTVWHLTADGLQTGDKDILESIEP